MEILNYVAVINLDLSVMKSKYLVPISRNSKSISRNLLIMDYSR